MNWFSWLQQQDEYTDAAMTVRAQNLPPLEEDRLIHDIFFPRRNVDSMKLTDLITTVTRYVADRREWNTRGRLIPITTPTRAQLEFMPIESYFTIEEREINELLARTQGNQAQIRNLLGVNITDRTDGLVRANQRRMEFDALRAWALGTVTVMNPQTGASYVASLGHDVGRHQTAVTAWDDPGQNAWNNFISWITEANDTIPGGVRGVVLRQNSYNVIQADAPQGLLSRALSRAEFESLLAQQLGFAISFVVLENWLDEFDDAGVSTVRRRVWEPGVIAAIPSRTSVGYSAYAPVVRAYELSGMHPDAKIDRNGMAVYSEISNNGRMFTRECQVNAFPVPEEQYIYTIDDGVSASTTA